MQYRLSALTDVTDLKNPCEVLVALGSCNTCQKPNEKAMKVACTEGCFVNALKKTGFRWSHDVKSDVFSLCS